MEQAAPSALHAAPRSDPFVVRRAPELVMTLVIGALVVAQRTGQLVRDTKLDLSIDPGRFLASVTHLWNPTAGFGMVPDQAYGYLFPMGPFYWFGTSTGAPEWIVQRAWLWVLLTSALWGTIRLADALEIGGRWSRLAGGVAYACSPLVLAQIHDTAYVIPAALLPWVLAPLVRAGNGTLTNRSAAARSGLAVLLMGGINATATFGVLLLPLLWFATRRPVRAHLRLFGLWVVAVAAATVWFLIPLLFQRTYGFSFLAYTERAVNTTGSTYLPEVLRGAGIWTSFGGTPVWTTAGTQIESAPAVIVAASLIAGAGLFGLARRTMPERRWLGIAVVVGAVLVCAGYWGHLGGPWAPSVHRLLDGPLAPFRNLNKFQPVITLPLVLGLVETLGLAARAIRKMVRTPRVVLGAGLVAGAVAMVAVSAAPLPTGQVYPEGSFTAIPAYWHQAVSWLNARGGTSTTIVLPGTNFADFTWGNPLDQPIQVLSTVPWANRNIVPIGSVGNTQFLDAIDQALSDGQPVPGLAAYLSDAGVRYLLVENDLTPEDTQSPPPVVLRQVLAQEPGLDRVASFGPLVRKVDTGSGVEALYDPFGLTRSIHALDLYRVGPATGADARVTTYPASSGVVLSGGPQGVLAAADAGLLRGEAVTLAGDPLGPRFTTPVWVDADTQQRRDTQYTVLYDNESNILAPGQTSAASGRPPYQWIVVPGDRHETTGELLGAARITASSFGPIFNSAPGQQPLEAFLADAGGAAWEATSGDPEPWVEIQFDHPIPLTRVTFTPSVGPFETAVTKVRITTDRGQVTASVAPGGRPQVFRTPAGLSRRLRITLVGLRGGPDAGGPGLADVVIPGVTVTQRWQVPADGPSTPGVTPTYLFSSPMPDQFSVFKVADDETNLSREFTVPHAATFVVTGSATPRQSPLLVSRQFPPPGAPAVRPLLLLAPFSLPCGAGPTIDIDGHAFATSLHGTVGDLYALHPLALSLCGFGGAISLGAGIHTVTADDAASEYKVTTLVLRGTTPPVGPSRAVTVTQWGNDTRALTVAAGPAALLNVHENYNPGWVASVGGQQLHAVRLDGWQQGWVLPQAAARERVTMRFVPDGPFRAGLVVGAVIAVTLLAWVGLTVRRPRRRGELPAIATNEQSHSSGAAIPAPEPRHSALRTGLWVGALTLALFAVAGPAAVAVPACLGLGLLARRRGQALPWIAFGAEVLAGVIIAVHPGYRIGVLAGSGSYTAQALGALALAALGVSLLPVFDGPAEA